MYTSFTPRIPLYIVPFSYFDIRFFAEGPILQYNDSHCDWGINKSSLIEAPKIYTKELNKLKEKLVLQLVKNHSGRTYYEYNEGRTFGRTVNFPNEMMELYKVHAVEDETNIISLD